MDAGFIKTLNFLVTPINQTFVSPNYLSFSPTGLIFNPDISLDLNFVSTGTFGQAQCSINPALAAGGQVCTPIIPQLVTPANPNGLSELNLMNTSSSSSTLSFGVQGTARRISTGELSQVSGTFKATLSTSSFQSVLSTLSSNGSVPVDYQFSFTATPPVPEPGTFVIGAIGMAGVFLLRWRRSAKVPELANDRASLKSNSEYRN